MIECIRGFVRPKQKMTSAAVIKKFRENAFKNGVVVKAVIFCVDVGDGVFSLVANVEMPEVAK